MVSRMSGPSASTSMSVSFGLAWYSHLLGVIPYGDVPHEEPSLPDRVFNPDYEREVLPRDLYVPQRY